MSAKKYVNSLSLRNQAGRGLWSLCWALFFLPSPRIPGFWAWRRMILRLFGAKIGNGAKIYPTARIWAPWNLRMGDHSLIGPHCDIYNVAMVALGSEAWVSQYSFLCSASHDTQDRERRLVSAPIEIGDGAWVAADAFIGPGIKVGKRAVVGARASVFHDVAPRSIVGGNPAKPISRVKV